MDRSALTSDVLARLALGEAARADELAIAAWESSSDPVAAALLALVGFWRGNFLTARGWADRALATEPVAPDVRALACAAAGLAASGDLDVDRSREWHEGAALLGEAVDPADPDWSLIRYLLAEGALVGARLIDARRVLAGGPPAANAWTGHPFAPMMHACDVRSAAFAGEIGEAASLLDTMRASITPGSRLEVVHAAVASLVLGNADDAAGVRRSIETTEARITADRDFVDRGVLLLMAFGAIAIGDTATAARMVFSAGDDGDLTRTTIIDRALGFEMFLVAALAEEDVTAVQAWLSALAELAEHPVAAPTVARARARAHLEAGEVAAAIAELHASIEGCRRDGRGVEAAEAEILLARARIAGQDVAGASRDLRHLVHTTDAAGHHAVRRSAASTLQSAKRRLPPVAGGGWAALSDREEEVARCVLDGLEVEAIAATLFLSTTTVRSHISRVLCAFGVPTRIGLLAVVGPSCPQTMEPPELSPRQGQVAALVAAGRPNQEIAAELGISVKGVEKHVTDILGRWSARSRFEIARIWWAAQVPADRPAG